MKKAIFTDNAPQAIGPYSQAIECGNMVYLSGQIPLDPKTMCLCSEDIRAQAIQVFENIKNICIVAGGSLEHIVKITIYLLNLSDFNIVNEIMEQYFIKPYPARVTIAVSKLPKDALIEIDAIMAK